MLKPSDLFEKVQPNLFYKPIQILLDALGEDTGQERHTLAEFYTRQISEVAKAFMLDDCSLDGYAGEILGKEEYTKLLRFINNANPDLKQLSEMVTLENLEALARKINPDVRAKNEVLLRIRLLFKLALAYVLVERLEVKTDDFLDLVKPPEKQALLGQFYSAITTLSNFHIKSHARAPAPVRSSWVSELLSGSLLSKMLSKHLDIVRNLPLLWQSDLTLMQFWRNLFWASRSVFLIIAVPPMVIMFLLPFQAMKIGFKKITDLHPYLLVLPIAFSVFLASIEALHLLSLISDAFTFGVSTGGIGLFATAIPYVGPLFWLGPPLALAACAAVIVGLGAYRSVIVPVLDLVGKQEWLQTAQIKNRIVDENQTYFEEQHQVYHDFRALLNSPVYIPVEERIALSNKDLMDLKFEVIRKRFDIRDEYEQARLTRAFDNAINTGPDCSLETYKNTLANDICNRPEVDIEDLRPWAPRIR